MSRTLIYKSQSLFHDRLYEIIGTDIQKWSRLLNVSPATISNRWYKGAYPSVDKIEKICTASNKSADWLVSGLSSNEASEGSFITNDPVLKSMCERMKKIFEYEGNAKESLSMVLDSIIHTINIIEDKKRLEEEKGRMKELVEELLKKQVELERRIKAIEYVHTPEDLKVMSAIKQKESGK